MPRRSLGQASLLLLGSTWIHSGLGLIASVLIGRILGPAAVGALALNLGLAGLVMAAALPGFARAHLKRLAEGEDVGRCLGTMGLIQGGLAAILGLVLLVAWRVGALAGAPAGAAVFVFMLGSQVALRLADVFMQVFIVRERVVTHGAILLSMRLTRLLATVVVLVVAPSVVWIAATFLLESALTLIVAAGVLAAGGVRPRAPSNTSLAAYWRFGRPFLIITPLALIQDSIDRVLVGHWAGLVAAGYYQIARGLFEVISGVMAPPGMLMFTRLSSLYAVRTPERDHAARRLFFGGLDKLLFLSTAMAVFFWVMAEPLLGALYGPSFVAATPALRILVLAALAATVINPYTFVLQAQDEVARFIPVNVVRFMVYLVALFVLIPGMIPGLPAAAAGAALARLLLIVIPFWVWMGWTSELAGIPFYWRALAYFGGFGVAVLVFHALVSPAVALAGSRWAGDVGAGAVAFVVYALWLLKAHPNTRANFEYTLGLPLGLFRRR
jgi:O-antigen/teichoic acid export membrane protein